jgi:tetratricopeptide (TPR) repeat protein
MSGFLSCLLLLFFTIIGLTIATEEGVKSMNIGEYLRNKRIEKGYTQEKLAELVEVDERTIRRIEKNASPKETESLKKIYDVLGISISDGYNMSMLELGKEMGQLNPTGIISKLGGSSSQEIMTELEKNLSKAFEFAKKENYKEALDIYLAFAKLFPSEFLYLGCANMYLVLSEDEKAIDFCDKILAMKTYQYEALCIKGISLGELKNFDSAIEAFQNALLFKQTYKVHYCLGVSYMMKRKNYDAISHYKKCLELNPNFAPAHLNIGICYFNVFGLEESLHHIDEALSLDPDMYEVYGRKGEYYRFMEQHDEAIKYFEKCLKLDNKNYQSLLGISMSFAVNERFSESAIYFKRFFELYSDNLFRNNKEIGHKVLLVDFGYKATRFITLEYESTDIIKVCINGICFPVSIRKDNNLIFIGAAELSDETGSIFYPMVGKIYQDKSEFNEVIKQIQASVQLFQCFDQPQYVDFERAIKVNITERQNNVLIEMIFGDKFNILGITDGKSGGLESFVGQYNEYEQFRIHLECASEVFIIDGLSNVSIDLLHD